MKQLLAAAVGVLALLLVGGTASVRATKGALGTEPTVEVMQSSGNCIATFGLLLLAWTEDRGAGHRIMAKRVRTNGLPYGGLDDTATYELAGATGPDGQKGDQRGPDLGWLDQDNRLLVWSELAPGGTDYDIYGQRIRPNGLPFGAPKLLIARPGDQVQPSVGFVSEDLLVLVWSENMDDAGDIYGQRLTSALTADGRPFVIVQGPGASTDPGITPYRVTSDGPMLVAWTDDRNGNLDIFGLRLAENGLPVGSPVTIIQGPQNDYAPALFAGLHTVGAVEKGRATILWTTEHPTDGPDVMGQALESNGLAKGDPFVVAGGPDGQSLPAVALENDTGWLTVWAADRAASLAIEGVEVVLNGMSRRQPRVLQIVY